MEEIEEGFDASPDFSSLVFGLGNERAPLLTLFNERHVRKGDKGDTMGESTTVHDLFASSRAPRFDRARRAAVFQARDIAFTV